MISPAQRFAKRCFDIGASFLGLVCTCWILIAAYIVATIDTRKNGFFLQTRIGRNGVPFRTVKIRTMRDDAFISTTVTTSRDPRITTLGGYIRKYKIDELPQLMNVLFGDMSIVGPRPDVPGFADMLTGNDRIILSVRPGITGPATLKYRNEEELLALQDDPDRFNKEVLFCDKVRLNREYIENYSFVKDIGYIIETLNLSKRCKDRIIHVNKK
jgi:lipopolysaccharide/colanic/teichoic acid biosynthesis glycosyltransferase